ncbi:hypothetical protein BSNT_07911 [Bacillus subtilis subsp. natto BEST195]|nr:hypothetical protein BSNT_07911 [Bacillus subtilis subsp. natto BEST195]
MGDNSQRKADALSDHSLGTAKTAVPFFLVFVSFL